MSQISKQKRDINKTSQSISNNHENQNFLINDSIIGDDDDPETINIANNPKFIEILEHSRQRHQTEGGISLEEMRNRLGLNKTVDNG